MSLINIISQISGGYDNVNYQNPDIGLTDANIIADGNSYVQGNGYTPFPSIIAATSPFNSNGAVFYNFGVGAQTTPQMITDQASQVLSLYDGAVNNILLVVEGGNDIYYNGSASGAITNLDTYCSAARSAGFYVIVSTCIRRDQTTSFGDNPSQYNTKLDSFNTLLAASTFYDGIIRPDLDAVFATYTSGGYDADHVHPNNTGQQKFADLFITAINDLGL